MGAIKNCIIDVCYMHRDGLSNEEIAERCDIDIEDVQEIIDLYYGEIS